MTRRLRTLLDSAPATVACSRYQIEQLAIEAAFHGDAAMAAHCETALRGDTFVIREVSREVCARAVLAAIVAEEGA